VKDLQRDDDALAESSGNFLQPLRTRELHDPTAASAACGWAHSGAAIAPGARTRRPDGGKTSGSL